MKTQRIKLDAEKVDMAKIKEAAGLVDEGALAAFPTETVYGIAARVRKDTISRLSRLKGRSDNKHYTLHIAKSSEVFKYVPVVPLRARKLVQNAWPGPLTLVFPLDDSEIAMQKNEMEKEVFDVLYKNRSIGIRCPDNSIASALLEQTKSPVVAPSANISDQPPAVNADQVLDQLSGEIEVVLDGGPCRYRKSSTVAKIERKGIRILREGVYSALELEALSQIRFLFVCTGNTCRSPMAEGIFKKYLAEKLDCKVDELEKMGYKVSSAGMLGATGYPAAKEAINACAKQGTDIGNHRNRALTKELIEESDFVFAMERMHLMRVLALAPNAQNRCLLLDGDKGIPDPIGQSQRVYDNCAKVITKAVRERIGELIT